MNTKQQIFDQFNEKISKTCITWDDCEWGVTGHYCRITPAEGHSGKPIPDQWDLWLCNSKDMTKGLGTGKRNNLIEALGEELDWNRLDGEAFVIVPTDLILSNLPRLGIRTKRILSEDQKEKARARLAKLRQEMKQ